MAGSIQVYAQLVPRAPPLKARTLNKSSIPGEAIGASNAKSISALPRAFGNAQQGLINRSLLTPSLATHGIHSFTDQQESTDSFLLPLKTSKNISL